MKRLVKKKNKGKYVEIYCETNQKPVKPMNDM